MNQSENFNQLINFSNKSLEKLDYQELKAFNKNFNTYYVVEVNKNCFLIYDNKNDALNLEYTYMMRCYNIDVLNGFISGCIKAKNKVIK